ncbi:CgeB family protein [Polyangium aurulentum]|uniref:CgeB family protein n=1 Tax=Polyangium aurulentum TaxID=2567896 RepID=UPI0010ADF3BE|nr:glycosyltransferase [Polyangium aurulentum]UQA59414.1 glycosyltransferase [Polyangium aurulentum]
MSLSFVILGLSITSSWGNGHATTYRGLARELSRLGHRVLFLERDVPWYRDNRDLPSPPYCRTELYATLEELFDRFAVDVRDADLTIVGSYVPDGCRVGDWAVRTARGPVAFYDIDTPVTLRSLEAGTCEYLSPAVLRRYDLYLSFTGGPILGRIEKHYGVPRARPLYCSADPSLYSPEAIDAQWTMGYLGTYSDDRQPVLDKLLVEPARRRAGERFVVAGPQYPVNLKWPENVTRVEHVPPSEHRRFYCSQRYTLNVTRQDMVSAGYSPSVRLFEAAACGTPIISDAWEGLDTFFTPDSEILIARTSQDVLRIFDELPEERRLDIGRRARARVLKEHTAAHRAATLEGYARELIGSRALSDREVAGSALAYEGE